MALSNVWFLTPYDKLTLMSNIFNFKLEMSLEHAFGLEAKHP
jgi:hypothetical protein